MAGGGVPFTSGGVQRKGKLTPYVAMVAFVAASGGLLFGYDIGITGGVTAMPEFQKLFFPNVLQHVNAEDTNPYCKYDDQMLQLFTSSLFIAGLFSGLLGSVITRVQGRRATMLYAGIAFLIGAGLTAGAVHVAMLVIGRISLGIGVGFANQVVPMYLSEIAPANLRGALNIMFQMATTLGILGAQLINYGTHHLKEYGFRISLALAGVPAIILTIGGIVLPDTPNSLMDRGYPQDARAILEKVRGTKDVDSEYEDIKQASELTRSVKNPLANIMSRGYRAELTMAILIPVFQQFTGINAIMFYAPVLFSSLGSSESTALVQTCIIGLVNVFSTLVAIFMVDKWGRKVLFLEGGIQMLASEVVVAIVLGILFSTVPAKLSAGAAIGVIVVICVYVAGFAWSWGPLGWLVPSEIQPLETRSAGMGITVAVNFICSFIIGQAFLSMLCTLKFGIFLFFAGWVLAMTLFVVFFLPETKGVQLEEISGLFAEHWFWRRFMADRHLVDSTRPKLEGSLKA